MKFIPLIREQIETSGQRDSRSGSWFASPKILSGLALAAVLALTPLPTFAQHGGGGGGGGSHGGGSGGGGSHVSGGSSGHSSGGHAGSAPSGTARSNGTASGTSGGGHWWNPFHGSSSNSTSSETGAKGTTADSTTERFAANNNSWQAPPATGTNHTTMRHYATNTAAAPRPAIASPPHVPVPRRGRGYGGYYPWYPYYGGYGFGLGFGGLGFGWYAPCDPFWGCYGYGFDGGLGYGYYGGGSFSGNASADLTYAAGDDAGSSQEPNPSLYAQAPETTEGTGGQTAGPIGKHVIAVLYLKDGSSYAVTDYWLENGKLHYVASYGGENAIDESALDLQKTVNENAAQGLTFTLRPAPENAPVRPDAGAPQQ